ncbi:MAG: phospholipid carrier-dependent glycosyltransferase, partial [Thermoanaerobaculales bacterium]
MTTDSVSGNSFLNSVGRAEREDRRPVWLVLWILVAVAAMLAGLGSDPLANPDEARNAEVAREMAAGNDYWLPQLNGLPYADKPVLFFAAAAAVMEILGPTELAARTAPLLFALATAALVGWFGRRLYGPTGGWIAAFATLSAPLAFAFARIVIMDSALSFFITAALVFFSIAIETRRAATGRDAVAGRLKASFRWTLLAWVAIALGVLTKGPVAILFPLLVAAPFAAWRHASRAVWHPVAPLVLLIVVGPWVWVVSQRLPDFLHYVVVTETWRRISSDELRRSQPFWYYLPVMLAGTFPWWIPATAGIIRRPRLPAGDPAADPHRVFLVLWALAPVAVLSLSTSKMPQYVLPVVPAVALLAAGAWAGRRDLRPAGAMAAVLIGALAGLALVIAAFAVNPEAHRMPPAMVRAWPGSLAALGMTGLIAAGLATLLIVRRRQRDLLAVALSLPVLMLSVVGRPLVGAYMERRSSRPFVEALAPHVNDGVELLGVASYCPALSFYLGRTMPVASP